jgi:hypothetical protein
MNSKNSGPQKTCPTCGEKNHVRKKECSCGYEFPKKKTAGVKSSKDSLNSAGLHSIKDVLLAVEILEKSKSQNKTIEEFVSNISLDWLALEDIKSMEELNELRSLQKFGELLERLGEQSLIEFVEATQSAKQEI